MHSTFMVVTPLLANTAGIEPKVRALSPSPQPQSRGNLRATEAEGNGFFVLMTGAAGALLLQSSTQGDELLFSKWSEAHVSANGRCWLPVPNLVRTPWRCPLYSSEYGFSMYACGIDFLDSRKTICRHGMRNIKLLDPSQRMLYKATTTSHLLERQTPEQNLENSERQLHGLLDSHCYDEHALADTGSLIALCVQEENLEAAQQLHATATTNGLHLDEHVGSYSIHTLYSIDRSLKARLIYSNLSTPDLPWSLIISSHAKDGQFDHALVSYCHMKNTITHFDSHVFVPLLEGCSAVGYTIDGRSIRSDLLVYGCAGHSHVYHGLVGKKTDALQIYIQKEISRTTLDVISYVSLLNACCGVYQLEQGRLIYCKIMENGVELDSFLGNNLIEMFCRCSNFTDACCAFHRLRTQDVEVWIKPITTFVQSGNPQEAVQLLQVMHNHSIEPDWSQSQLVLCLRELFEIVSIKEGELLHSYVVKSGMEAAAYLGWMLVDMYFCCGSVDQASKIFNELEAPDAAAWSALIRGYHKGGHDQKVVDCFNEMLEDGMLPDKYTSVCILKGCASLAALCSGQRIHFWAVVVGFDLNLVVCNSLVVMYSRCGPLEDARAVFDRLTVRDVITWNSMIDGYSKHGFAETSLSLYHQMCLEGVQPNLVTYVSTLKACSTLREIEQGRQMHAQLMGSGIMLDPIVSNALLDVYSKCGSFEDARYMFDGLSKQAVIPWNTLMAGYSLYKKGYATFDLFRRMQVEGPEPDSITFVCVLKACLNLFDIEQGKEIHAHIVKSGLEMDVYIGNILVSLYGHCGSMEDAHKVFSRMQKRDVVTWSALMTGYTQTGQGKEVLEICEDMWIKGMDLDEAAFVCILKACSDTAALEQGRAFHGYAVEKACELNPPIAATLMTMYGKCGDFNMACLVFNKTERKSVVSYNAMLAILGAYGQSRSSVQLFESMNQVGMKPNNITFTCLLSACRSLELVDEACYHFASMEADHGIVPEAEHYGCILDILAKGRLFDTAEDLLETIPLASNIVGWTSLLSSCNGTSDIDLGQRCFNCAVNIDPTNAAVYVLMSNLYKCAGLHKNAEEVESMRKHGNKWKKPGRAYIEVDKKVHEFVVGDKAHPQIEKIHLKVKALRKVINDRISMPHSNLPNLPTAIGDKESSLCGHSEKLALAFGLLSTSAGTTIRVAKNIRMCDDCHTTSRLASLIENREIIVSDSYCVHRFRNGLCSCEE